MFIHNKDGDGYKNTEKEAKQAVNIVKKDIKFFELISLLQSDILSQMLACVGFR